MLQLRVYILPCEQLTSSLRSVPLLQIFSSPAPEYPFVKEPTQDFYCPVTFYLMLQPHRTSCCRQNMLQEVASILQRERKTCPMCRAEEWRTELNKELQEEVQVLRVFCPHVDRGCQWQGELRHFSSHVQSCNQKDAPLIAGRLDQTWYV